MIRRPSQQVRARVALPDKYRDDGLDCPWSEDHLSRQLSRLRNEWRRDDGMYATVFRGRSVVDDTPLVADLGDFAPFLAVFGQRDFALALVESTTAHLRHGLFSQSGDISLFDNHDFVLGLVELYTATKEQMLLERALDAVTSLERRFERRGLLVDRLHGGLRDKVLALANPFNGGYIELCCDLYELTDERWLLDTATRWARAWLKTPYFRFHGLFSRFNSARLPIAGYLASRLARHGPVRLFKDNTNMVWGLAALHRLTGETWLQRGITRFVRAFRRGLWASGRVKPVVGKHAEFQLGSAMATLDLLCDLAQSGVCPDALDLARGIAEACLDQQRPNGTYATGEINGPDHLDWNTDVGVGLWKLWELGDDRRYAEAAIHGWAGTLATHDTPAGLVMAVDASGRPADDRIIVKYQALVLKSALLWELPGEIYQNRHLWLLLRDR